MAADSRKGLWQWGRFLSGPGEGWAGCRMSNSTRLSRHVDLGLRRGTHKSGIGSFQIRLHRLPEAWRHRRGARALQQRW